MATGHHKLEPKTSAQVLNTLGRQSSFKGGVCFFVFDREGLKYVPYIKMLMLINNYLKNFIDSGRGSY